MAERLNYGVVETKLASFNASCDALYNALKDMDCAVSETVGIGGGAIHGQLGTHLINDWDNNCSRFLNFRNIFDEWHSAAIEIVAENAEFEKQSVEATVDVYKTGGAN